MSGDISGGRVSSSGGTAGGRLSISGGIDGGKLSTSGTGSASVDGSFRTIRSRYSGDVKMSIWPGGSRAKNIILIDNSDKDNYDESILFKACQRLTDV